MQSDNYPPAHGAGDHFTGAGKMVEVGKGGQRELRTSISRPN